MVLNYSWFYGHKLFRDQTGTIEDDSFNKVLTLMIILSKATSDIDSSKGCDIQLNTPLVRQHYSVPTFRADTQSRTIGRLRWGLKTCSIKTSEIGMYTITNTYTNYMFSAELCL